MNTLIDTLREIIGTPDFYKQMTSSTNYTWDYGAMLEYMIAGILVCIVVSSVFKFLRCLLK